MSSGEIRRVLIGVLAVLAVVGAVPSGAAAAPAWLGSQALSGSGEDAYAPAIAAGPDGTVLVAWASSDGTDIRIETRARPPGGSFAPPVAISAPGEDAFEPALAFDAAGDAIAVWSRGGRIEAALRPPGGSFGAPQLVSPGGESSFSPTVVFDSRGEAVIAWSSVSGTSPNLAYRVEATVRRADGSFSTPQQLAYAAVSSAEETVTFRSIQLAADQRGDVFATWAYSFQKFETPLLHSSTSIAAAVRPAGSDFSLPATTLASADGLGLFGEAVGSPALAVDPQGDALVLWSHEAGPGMQQIEAKERPTGGGFETVPEVVSGPASGQAAEPRVVLEPSGNAVAVWLAEVGGKTGLVVAERPAGGFFGGSRALSPSGTAVSYPSLVLTSRGEALAAWLSSSPRRVEAAARAPGAGFGPAQPVSGVAESALDLPRLAVDGQGDAVALWRRLAGHYVAELAAYDAVGPSLGGFSVPARGVVGLPLAFSVAPPLDVWSPPVSVTWSFGDGGSASGATASRVYAAAGTYRVTVTATDALGNASSASGTVAVTGSAAPVISNLRQTHRRWREGGRLAHVSARRGREHHKHRPKVPVGTTFSFSLNEGAAVALRFDKRLPGRRAGRRCVAVTRRNRKHRHCPRTVTRGHLDLAVAAGPNKVHFEGQLARGKRLSPGSYELTAAATDSGGRRSAPRELRFTVLGPG